MTDQLSARRTIELRIYDLESQPHDWRVYPSRNDDQVMCRR